MSHRTRATLLIAAARIFCTMMAPQPCRGAQLTAQTARAFDRYIAAKEAHSHRDLAENKNFLWIDALPQSQKDQSYARLKQGLILVQRDSDCGVPNCLSIPGGLVHDWIGIVFVPGISISQALAILQNYSADAEYYPSAVVKSKLLGKSGDDFHIYLRLKQVHVINIVLDTEYDIHYTRIDADHVVARSYSTRVVEVDHAGAANERDEPAGDDHGFLWRLDSYWRFFQADGGVYIQCNAVSLTRDVPAGLGWLIGSFIEKIPAESLHSTLAETRTTLLEHSQRTKENLP